MNDNLKEYSTPQQRFRQTIHQQRKEKEQRLGLQKTTVPDDDTLPIVGLYDALEARAQAAKQMQKEEAQ